MADNTVLNAASVPGGDIIASDDIGGVKYQRVKINFGVDGSAVDVSSGNPLPISIATMPTTPVTGAFFPATQPVSATALPLPTGAATDSAVNNANPYRGTCTYSSGVTGTVVVAAGARVVSISVMASLAATVTIFGGATIAVPAGTAFDERWTGFVGPGNIVFTNTSSYYVAVNL